MSREAFLKYWEHEHGPRVAGHLKAIGCKKYVQVRSIEGSLAKKIAESRGGQKPFDGVAELWFENQDQFIKHASTGSGMAAAKDLYKDEEKFIDMINSVIFLSEEQLVIEVN